MNKLIRETERQEVTTPLVSNRSVANDSLHFLLLYLRSFIYISFYTLFYWLILFDNTLSLSTIFIFFFHCFSSSSVFDICTSSYSFASLSACVNVQIGVSFRSSSFVVLCNCLFFNEHFLLLFHLNKIPISHPFSPFLVLISKVT